MPSDLIIIGMMNKTDDVSSLVGTTRFTSSFVHHLAATTTSTPSEEGTCEMDSHTDTWAVGINFVMLEKTDHSISVTEEYKPVWNIPDGTVATAWTDSVNHIILIGLSQSLFFSNCLQHSLICPNQLHANGPTIHNVPH